MSTFRSLALATAVSVVGIYGAYSQTNSPAVIPTSGDAVKPMMLERSEGELRTRRVHTDNSSTASSQFMLKVSPKNNGSQHLVVGTEVIPPGSAIQRHRHLLQDEILLIHEGRAHVWLGDQDRDLSAGGLVFIPMNTWISLKNIGAEPISLTFIFSAPGFDDTMRCNSVPAGQTPTQITSKQQRQCAELGDAEYASKPETRDE